MTYEEKKKVVEAAIVLMEYGKSREKRVFTCPGCLFQRINDGGCCLKSCPRDWTIPAITRWTPEDVALAKALKAVGVHGFYKNMVKGDVFWMDGKGNSAKLPKGCLTALENGTEILIDTIISEAAEG